MANQYGPASQYSYASPAPVAWTPDREARGAAPPRGPRCPHPSCPVRYVSGESRPCPEHAAPRPELTGAQRVMVRAVLAVACTPGRRRIVRALLADAARSNRVVARATATDHMCVRRVRHAMEAAGVITVYRAPSRPVTARAAPGRDRARAALLRDPARSNRVVAAEAAISYPVVMHARHAMEAAGLIAVYRARPWSASQQPASDQLASRPASQPTSQPDMTAPPGGHGARGVLLRCGYASPRPKPASSSDVQRNTSPAASLA